MAELTAGKRVLLPRATFRRATQLLAVAWLRWRIFFNNMFRRQPKGKRQVVGLVFAILLRMIVWPMLALIVVGPVAGSGFLRGSRSPKATRKAWRRCCSASRCSGSS